MAELETQSAISDEIATISKAYDAADAVETQPRTDYPPYRSSLLRHPTKDLHHADPEGVELQAPCFGERDVDPLEADLTIQHGGDPVGKRMRGHRPGARRRRDARSAGSSCRSGRPTRADATRTSATSTRPRWTRTSPALAAA